jgi:hypothetical protein
LPSLQTVTTGEPKEDHDQKTKKGKQPDKRRKKESGQSKKKDVQFSVVAEADSRILSALLTVSSLLLSTQIVCLQPWFLSGLMPPQLWLD